MTKLSPIITDIVHTATQASLADDEQIQRQGLADIYDAIASVLHVDHRAAKPAEASTDEPPAVSGCPSLGPKVFPSGADGTEQAPEKQQPQTAVVRPQRLDDIGMKMEKRVTTDENGVETRIHYAGIRHVTAERPAQLWEIDVAKCDTGSHITCWRDHERVFSGSAFFGLSQAADVAISMMIRKIIGDTKKKYRDHFRMIRRNTAETKALIAKELA